MSRLAWIVLWGISGLSTAAQSTICMAEWARDPYCIFTVQHNEVTFQEPGGLPEVVLSYRNNRVYAGTTPFGSSCLFTIFGDQIFYGNSTMSKDCAYSISGDYVYRGNSYRNDAIVYTLYNHQIFKGASTSGSDLLYVYTDKGELSPALIVCIISGYE